MPGGEPVLDSPVNNATAHYLHNMLYLLGPTRATSAMPVTVQAELYRANDIRSYDTAAMRVMTDGDVEVLFFTTHAAGEQLGPVCRFEFENGLVEYDAADGGEFVARFHDGRIRRYGSPNLDRHLKVWQCIEAARNPSSASSASAIACGIRAALPHTLSVLAAQESTSEIASFPESMRKFVPDGADQMIVVEGLGEALMECCRRGVLPNEHCRFGWSISAKSVRVPALRWDEHPTVEVQTFVQPAATTPS
jgi:predicted dehydrogenase